MAGNNLKTNITADTSDFKKGMRDAKNALNDFSKQGTSALSNIADAVGIPSQAIDVLTRNIKNATNLITEMGRTGAGAMTTLERAVGLVGGAIAGLGIGAAIIAFKELNTQAEMFRNTIAGANLELQAQVYRDTFRMAMEDQLGMGASLQGTKNKVKRAATEVSSVVGNAFNTGVDQALKAGNIFEKIGGFLVSVKGITMAAGTAMDKASAASQYQGELNKALNERMNKTAEWTRMSREIAEYERIAANTSLTQAERQAAVAEAMKLQTQLGSEQEASAKEIYKWTSLVSDQATDSVEETQALLTAQSEVDNVLYQQEQKMKSLEKLQNRIAKGAGSGKGLDKTAIEAYESSLEQVVGKGLAAELNAAIGNEILKNDVNVQRIYDEGFLDLMKKVPEFSQTAEVRYPVKLVPQVDTKAAQNAIIELSSVVESGVVGMSDAIGELVGNLINGEDAWGNFAQAGISVIADMLSTVGKAFVATGTGVVAAELALKSGNGYAAIAAGTAMVALAATMKTVMSNAAANWGGGYSAPVASSAYTPGTSLGTYGREMEIKVTGTLTAEGSKLKAVLNNEDYRTNITT